MQEIVGTGTGKVNESCLCNKKVEQGPIKKLPPGMVLGCTLALAPDDRHPCVDLGTQEIYARAIRINVGSTFPNAAPVLELPNSK